MAKQAKYFKKHEQNFVNYVQLEMRFLGMTVPDLARLTGYDNSLFYGIFSGRKPPTTEIRYMIIQAFARVIEGRDRVKFFVPKVGMPDGDDAVENSSLYPDWPLIHCGKHNHDYVMED